jgi:hypothetical protein
MKRIVESLSLTSAAVILTTTVGMAAGVPERHYRVISGNPCTTQAPDEAPCLSLRASGMGSWGYIACATAPEGTIRESNYEFFGPDELKWGNEMKLRGAPWMSCRSVRGTSVFWQRATEGTVILELQGRQTDAREGRVEAVSDISLPYGPRLLLRLESKTDDGEWVTLAEDRQLGGTGTSRQTRRLSATAPSLAMVRFSVIYEGSSLSSLGLSSGAELYDASLSLPFCVPDPATGQCEGG